MPVSLVTRQEGVAASLLFQWRKLERQGALTAVSAGEAVVPASELAAARAEIAKLQRVLGKKTLENEILRDFFSERAFVPPEMPDPYPAGRRDPLGRSATDRVTFAKAASLYIEALGVRNIDRRPVGRSSRRDMGRVRLGQRAVGGADRAHEGEEGAPGPSLGTGGGTAEPPTEDSRHSDFTFPAPKGGSLSDMTLTGACPEFCVRGIA